jgi:hypothetical protein
MEDSKAARREINGDSRGGPTQTIGTEGLVSLAQDYVG